MTIQPRSFAGAAAGLVAGVLLMSFAGIGGLLARDNAQNPSAVLACAPSERMLTRQIVQNGQLQTIAECVPAATVQTAAIRNAAAAPRAASVRRTSSRAAVAQDPEGRERSWKQTALVIGGSAGAGAGIGGAIKGGKGALIGAAIGGGAAAIYEAIKRKDQ